MSSCEIYVVRPNGDVEYYDEARNSFGGAMLIWTYLQAKYQVEEPSAFTFERTWAKVNEMDPIDRWVMSSTFDNVMVRREHLPELIAALETFMRGPELAERMSRDMAFLREEPRKIRPSSSTLEAEVVILRRALADPDVIAVCWNQTSVNADAWRGQTMEETDGEYEAIDETIETPGGPVHYRRLPYNIHRDDRHWFLEPSRGATT